MASLETTRGRQVPAWQQANRYYQQPVDYVNVRQLESTNVSTAPATRKRRSTNGSYKIQKGDTLSAIAKRYGTTVQAIAEANGIADVNKIYVGDSLNIPGNATARTTNAPTQRTNTSSATTNQNMRARQNRIDTAIAVSKVPRTLSVNRNFQQSTNNTNTSQSTARENNYDMFKIPTTYAGHYMVNNRYVYLDGYLRNQIAGPDDNIGKLGQVYLTRYIMRKRNASGKANTSTSRTNSDFSQQDMQAIRLSQQQNPPVLYNTRSKPSLRRYQRYK